MRRLLLALMLAFFALTGLAKEAPPASSNPQIEKRLMTLASQLRCLVCQNETLADSPADLARDLRAEIREKMMQGQSDKQIVDYLVARYGDYVLYRPPLMTTTVLLWFGPFLLVIIGLAWLVYRLRKRRATDSAPLSDAEHARAAALLAEQEGGSR